MLEELINLVKEHAGDAVINNPAIPNEQNQAVIEETGNSIKGGLEQMISQGNLNEVLNLFHGGGAGSTSAVQNISGGLIQNLITKLGINPSVAQGVAGNLIPKVLQSLVHKTNDPADSSFDLQGIISSLGGGSGAGGILGNLTGGGSGNILQSLEGLLANKN